MNNNEKFLYESYIEKEDEYIITIIRVDEELLFIRRTKVPISKSVLSKETLEDFIKKDYNNIDKVFKNTQKSDIVRKNNNSRNLIISAGLVALLIGGSAFIISREKANLKDIEKPTVETPVENEIITETPTIESPVEISKVETPVEEVDEINKEFFETIDATIFKEQVDSIIKEYAESGFEADYKGVSATLLFSNMQSIDPEVVENLVAEGYLESDLMQNFNAMINLDAKIRHINGLYKTDGNQRFISILPMIISNKMDYENALYSEELLLKMKDTTDATIIYNHLEEYKNHVLEKDTESKYKNNYEDLSIGYRTLNLRFLAPVFYYITADYIDKDYREELNDYSTLMNEIVIYSKKYSDVFENFPQIGNNFRDSFEQLQFANTNLVKRV